VISPLRTTTKVKEYVGDAMSESIGRDLVNGRYPPYFGRWLVG
jgi:hypothetical protein